ncbi:MAG: helix-turn-helix domain-containing protein [Flavobacteriales bacterium]
MFRLNTPFIIAKGHAKPSVLLRKCGAAEATIKALLTRPIANIKITTLTNLCLALNCTPNDLLTFTPPSGKPLPEGHALNTLAPTAPFDMLSALQNLPKDKLLQVQQIMSS